MLELLLGFIAAPAIEIQYEEFPLADVAHCGVAEAGEGVLDRLSLGVEYGAFWHYPDVCFRAVPCGRRLHTLRAAWCETWPDHRWKAQWVCRGAGVWGADDLRFLRLRAGVAGRGRRFSCCLPGIFQVGSFAPRGNPLAPDRGSRLFRGRCAPLPAIRWLREFSLGRRPRRRASSGADPIARRGRRRGGIPLSERSARLRRCRRPRWLSNRSALRIRRLPSLRPHQIAV